MSSEETGQEQREPVNIDELEVNIFVIAKNSDAFKNASQFLTRRGWPTTCVANVSKAIGTIVQQSPDVVLISVDHPNPNVSRLPVLLAQTLNTTCIGFTEDGGALSISKLNKSRFKYKFTGFPSGPSLHRFLRQTLDSIYNPTIEDPNKNKNKDNDSNDSNTIQVKGSNQSGTMRFAADENTVSGNSYSSGADGKRKKLSDYNTTAKSDNGLSAAEMLEKLKSGDDYSSIKKANKRGYNSDDSIDDGDDSKTNTENFGVGSSEDERSGEFGSDYDESNGSDKNSEKGTDNYYQGVLNNAGTELSDEEKAAKKARAEKKKKAFPWQKVDDDADDPIKNQKNRPGASFDLKQNRNPLQPDSDDSLQSAEKNKKGMFDLQHGEKSKNGLHVPEAEEKKKKSFDEQALELQKKGSQLQQGEAEDEPNAGTGQESALSDSALKATSAEQSISTNQLKDKIAEGDAAPGATKPPKNPSREIAPEGRKLTEEENKFKEGVKNAFKETCEEPDPSVYIKIDQIEKLGIIPVDSQKIHGYFVIGRGGIGFSLGTVFLSSLAEAVEKFLALQGIDVQCQTPFLMETNSFNFEQWASKVDNFTLFEQSGREEIALTFIPTPERIPHIVDSEIDPNKARISVQHLSTNKAVNFESFIHLEKNSRFYKYLKPGAKILPRQKEKLKNREKDIFLHINKSEFESFKKYVAESLIQELVKKVSDKSDDGNDSGSSAA